MRESFFFFFVHVIISSKVGCAALFHARTQGTASGLLSIHTHIRACMYAYRTRAFCRGRLVRQVRRSRDFVHACALHARRYGSSMVWERYGVGAVWCGSGACGRLPSLVQLAAMSLSSQGMSRPRYTPLIAPLKPCGAASGASGGAWRAPVLEQARAAGRSGRWPSPFAGLALGTCPRPSLSLLGLCP
jgi:hypothetical protein